MKLRLSIIVFLICTLAAAAYQTRATVGAAEPDDKDKALAGKDDTDAFMRVKLSASQLVLEGLVSKDFQQIRAGAKQLVKMSDAAAWGKMKDPVYRHYHAEFRRLATKIDYMAEKGNLEGASFTYMHTVTMCISCHEYVRDVDKITDRPKVKLLGKPPALIGRIVEPDDQ